MKLKIILLSLLLSSNALAAPTSTITTTQGGVAKVGLFARLHSWHHFHLRNDTAAYKAFKLGLTLCPADKPDQCEIFFYDVGLSPNQEYDYDHHLFRDVIYRVTGEHSVNAASSINGVTLSQDQKYVWVQY